MKKLLAIVFLSMMIFGCDDNEHRWQARMMGEIGRADESCHQVTLWCRDGFTWYACEVGDEVEFVPGFCFE